MDRDEAVTRLLDAAEVLFYERGVQAVGMDEVRAVSGVSLKRLYQCFPGKEDLVVAYLRRRDRRWLESLADFVAARESHERVTAVFDWLDDWFRQPGFRGCAFINSVGELGATSPEVLAVAREHKAAVRRYLLGLVSDRQAGEALNLLVEGAIVTAAVSGDPAAARHARRAAAALGSGGA
ncbi:TetR/AcrR family transcriptional regulator [Actinokineospora enzanensis]|uniref:TetR/AcrR family transcriptional regulator n=1 Tax=Actinokineospora enzanensis TaxID=155975 RepID=UPI00037A6560|nr:TetR/AcrR family transcriptional regulator [Actinokineospora enzanensis]